MPHKSIIALFVVLASLNWHADAQLSPGDLVEAHAHLEGLLKCTKCHDLGEGVSESKCLACHTLLKERIDRDKGYHASNEIKRTACVSCHNDHHGRTFDIIRFDKDNFDHSLTGYVLEGAHLRQDCRSCHKDQFISNAEIRNKTYTFLGLETRCESCHR